MPSPEGWVLQIEPDVLKETRRLPKRDARKIASAVKILPNNPYFGDVQKLKGQENVWRRRIESYRLFYQLFPDEKIILVFRLERRTSTAY